VAVELVGRGGVQSAQVFADRIGADVEGGAADVQRSGRLEREQLMLINRQQFVGAAVVAERGGEPVRPGSGEHGDVLAAVVAEQ